MDKPALALLNIRERMLTRDTFQQEYGAMMLEGLESHEYVAYRGQRLVVTEKGKRMLADNW
jgi:hypothetical protein